MTRLYEERMGTDDLHPQLIGSSTEVYIAPKDRKPRRKLSLCIDCGATANCFGIRCNACAFTHREIMGRARRMAKKAGEEHPPKGPRDMTPAASLSMKLSGIIQSWLDSE